VAVPLDPAIGLFANFPGLLLALVASIGLLLYRRRSDWRGISWPAIDVTVALATCGAFLFTFSQASNVHHGGTPGMSRYGVWLIPLAIPALARAHVTGRSAWRTFLTATAVVSAAASIVAFRPAVPQNLREPSPLAAYLWTHHAGWNNPLPEVFSEVSAHEEFRSAPIWTRGCEKVLLIGRGASSPFPIPCFPAVAPDECTAEGVLCYANLSGRAYQFVRAPGSAVAHAGFTFESDRAWPAGAEIAVRRMLADAQWWTLAVRTGEDSALRFARGVRVTELHGPSRLLFVLRDIKPGAEMILRVPAGVHGALLDGMTGRVLGELRYQGTPLEPWPISLPPAANFMILTLSAP
jgi:hypothetical protein